MGNWSALSTGVLLAAFALTQAIGAPAQRTIDAEIYPEKCVRKAERIETVIMEFDTTAMGEPVNPTIIESTNSCFDEAAKRNVAQIRILQPAGQAGLSPHKDLRASIVFDRIKSPAAPERKIRHGVQRRLGRVLKALSKDDDPANALERLQTIEEKYGDEFSLAELAAHRMLRAAARLDAGDFDGALTDLYAAQDTGVIDAAPIMKEMTSLKMHKMFPQIGE